MMLSQIIRPLFYKLTEYVVQGIFSTYNNISSTRLSLLICYLILLFIVMFFVWRPFAIHLESEDIKTKKMLAVIPLELMLKIKHIHKYLEEKTIQTKQHA